MSEKSEMTEKEIQTKILELEEAVGKGYDKDGIAFFASESCQRLFKEIKLLKS